MIDKDLILNATGERVVRLPTGGVFALRSILDNLIWQKWPNATVAEKNTLDAIVAETIEGLGTNEMVVQRAIDYGFILPQNHPASLTAPLQIQDTQNLLFQRISLTSIRLAGLGWHRVTAVIRWSGGQANSNVAGWVDYNQLTNQLRPLTSAETSRVGHFYISLTFFHMDLSNEIRFMFNNTANPVTIPLQGSYFTVERLP